MESVFEIENHSKEIHLNTLFSNALHRQKTFKRVVPFHEDWTDFQLNNFSLESSLITRIYSIQHFHEIANEIGEVSCKFEICLQIKYKGKNIFLTLNYKQNYSFFSEQNAFFIETKKDSGVMCFTYDVNIFFKSMVKFYMKPGLIFQSLNKDKYNIFGDKSYNNYLHGRLNIFAVKGIPSLKTQCLMCIYENKYMFFRKHELVISKEFLPTILFEYINDFYKCMNTRKLFEVENSDTCVY